MIKEFFARLKLLIVRRPRTEVDEELRFHLQEAMDARLAAGMSQEEARRAALVEFGGVERTREQCYEARPGWWLGTVAMDVRYALRGFRRNPVFTIAVIATLAVGIGATTAVFSVVDRILFRALPYAHGERLVSFGLSQPLQRQEFMLGGFFFEWRDEQRPFSSVTFERGTNSCDLTEANPVHLDCAEVAQNFLPTLGVAPILGRNFLPEEDVPHGPQVAILSDGLWQSRFNRDKGVLGKSIEIDGHTVRIVGVIPKDFEMPRLQDVDILRPAQMDIAAQHTLNAGIGLPMWALGRLKPGLSVAMAREQMQPLFEHTKSRIPEQFRNEFRLEVRSVRDHQMHDAYQAAWILLGGVLAVLLIACANVASLFSARGAAREREMAVRTALGASRGRQLRQRFTESAMMALAGAAAGLGLAEILLRVFVAIAPNGVPFLSDAGLDARIVLFTLGVSVSCALLCGILPAMEKPRADALTARQTLSGAHARLRRVLVVAQIAVCVVLLSGASLLVKSFWNLEHESLGMEPQGVLAVRIPTSSARHPTGQMTMDFDLRVETALRKLPGVTAVGMSDSLPPDGDAWHHGMRYSDIFASGRPKIPAGTGGSVLWRLVSPDYFRVLKIPIVEGAGFTEAERSDGDFMILSNTLARRLYPDGNAIGQHIQFGNYMPYFVLDGPVFTVVGVAADVKNGGLSGDDEPEFYELRSNHHPESWDGRCMMLLETALPTATVAPWVRTQIAQIDATVPVALEPMTQTVSQLADRPRFETALLGFFAFCGLLMAVIGLYGVIAFVATQRTREIGVRMALGASRMDILRLIAGEGVRLIVLGGVLGLVASLAAAQVLKSLLFHVQERDPWTYAGVALGLGVVALVATLFPARAAMKVEPVVALRSE
jgi:putative ABC transport system permease protein